MCKKAECSTCRMSSIRHSKLQLQATANLPIDKATWWGCGNHVPMVMDSIPENERCGCEPKVEKEGKQYPPKAAQAP